MGGYTATSWNKLKDAINDARNLLHSVGNQEDINQDDANEKIAKLQKSRDELETHDGKIIAKISSESQETGTLGVKLIITPKDSEENILKGYNMNNFGINIKQLSNEIIEFSDDYIFSNFKETQEGYEVIFKGFNYKDNYDITDIRVKDYIISVNETVKIPNSIVELDEFNNEFPQSLTGKINPINGRQLISGYIEIRDTKYDYNNHKSLNNLGKWVAIEEWLQVGISSDGSKFTLSFNDKQLQSIRESKGNISISFKGVYDNYDTIINRIKYIDIY